MSHLALLGDSIFDNGLYVPGGSPLIEQLRVRLPRGWKATLVAVDGAVASSILRQIPRLPSDATHLVISAGGNDALENSGILRDVNLRAPAAFQELADVQDQFQKNYRAMLREVLALRKPTAVCTIYDSIPEMPRAALAALSVFNDVILREAVRHGIPVLDLRLLCDQSRDYSPISSIEPSEIGGAKIVQGIIEIVTAHDFASGRSVIYGKS